MSSARSPTERGVDTPPECVVHTLPRGDLHKEEWRYRCPNGHTAIRRAGDSQHTDKAYYCRTCRRDGDPYHSYIIDAKELEPASVRADRHRDVVIYDDLVDSGGGCDE